MLSLIESLNLNTKLFSFYSQKKAAKSETATAADAIWRKDAPVMQEAVPTETLFAAVLSYKFPLLAWMFWMLKHEVLLVLLPGN